MRLVGTGDPDYRRALENRASQIASELETLGERLSEIEQRREELLEEASHIEALLGRPVGESEHQGAETETPHERSIPDIVVDLLREVGKPLHYREIERELRARGLHMAGKDPANSLLARFFDDPRLFRPSRGTYALRRARKARSVGARRTRSKRQ